jgi:hypothetical protein
VTHPTRSTKEQHQEPRTQVRGPLFFGGAVRLDFEIANQQTPDVCSSTRPRRRSFKMLTNRITAYLPATEEEQLAEIAMPQDVPGLHNPLAPPANFAPVPEGLMQGISPEQLAWQQELYRAAYQSALAAIASEAFRRSQTN